MIKKFLISIVFLLVVIGAGSYFYFDSLVKTGIEVVGTRVLGTEVTVSSVALSPLNGSGAIADLRIQNPEGFNADYIFELGYVAVNINASSVFSDVVEIESITIAQPVITFETRITTDNVRALLANLPSSDSAETPDAGDGTGGKRVIIRELQILGPQLNVAAGIMSAPVQLPDIVLHNIGNENTSASVAEALRVVLGALRNSILQANLPNLDMLRDGVESSLQNQVEQAEEAIDGAVEDLGNRLRGILN